MKNDPEKLLNASAQQLSTMHTHESKETTPQKVAHVSLGTPRRTGATKTHWNGNPRKPLKTWCKVREGNQNSVKHGLRMKVSKAPPKCHYISVAVNEYRRALESLVMERRGLVDVYEQSVIVTACDFEKHRQLVARWLRLKEETMSNSDRLAFSKAVAEASERRDKCLVRLGLNEDQRPEVPDLKTYLVQAEEPKTTTPKRKRR